MDPLAARVAARYSNPRLSTDVGLKQRQTAYHAAKAIKDGKDVPLSKRTKDAARAYFEAEDKTKPLSERVKAGETLIEQIDSEKRAAAIALKMLTHWLEVFQDATGVLNNLSESEDSSVKRATSR